MSAAVAAIQFALDLDDGSEVDFLRLWNEGSFDALRKEWPEAPDACYIGADPLHPKTQQAMETASTALTAVELLGTLLETCSEMKLSYHRDGCLRSLSTVFKPTVETSTGYQKEVLQAFVSLKKEQK